MSGLDLRALREAAEAATPGPWLSLGGYVAHDAKGCTCGAGVGSMPHEGGCGLEDLATATARDAAFIAAANPSAVLALLDRVEAAEGAVERVRALAEFWVEADGEPATDRDLTVLNVTNRHGRELTAALRDLS